MTAGQGQFLCDRVLIDFGLEHGFGQRGTQPPEKTVFPVQVHGIEVFSATFRSEPDRPHADAIFTTTPSLSVGIVTADCVPILVAAEDGSAVAAIHAGWRGLAAGVIENTIAALNVEPASLLVWLGPAISQTAFEVGAEVRDAFLTHDPMASSCFETNARGRWQADLYGLARQRLNAAGVLAVSGGEYCTYSDEKRFYSYRRNPDCGRLVSFIGLLTP